MASEGPEEPRAGHAEQWGCRGLTPLTAGYALSPPAFVTGPETQHKLTLTYTGLIGRMGDASFFTGQYDTLSALSPSEQAVYVRLSVMSENGKVRGRYADIAKLANVSLSTFKRVVKSLSARGLVEVVWRQKTPSLFIVTEKSRARAGARPKLYDSFTPEDRELFLFAKRSVPPAEMKELQKEAMGQGKDVDLLILYRVFGAERIRKYEQLLETR
jgi:DNA-binding MarR family transcriptional regulator